MRRCGRRPARRRDWHDSCFPRHAASDGADATSPGAEGTMELGAFDQFVRTLTAAGSRRALLQRLAGSAVGGTLATIGLASTRADGKSAKGSDKSKGGENGGDKSKGG